MKATYNGEEVRTVNPREDLLTIKTVLSQSNPDYPKLQTEVEIVRTKERIRVCLGDLHIYDSN